MFPIDIFLTNYGYSIALRNSLNFAQKQKKQLLNVLRVDKFERGSYEGQILGYHIFYLVFANSETLGRLFVLGCEAKSGYSGSGPADFKTIMDWLTANEIEISYYSAHSYEEHFKFWGSEPNEYGQEVPSANGLHRKHGPSPWDYSDLFVQQSEYLALEEFEGLSPQAHRTQQEFYFCTLEFLLKALSSGNFLNFL